MRRGGKKGEGKREERRMQAKERREEEFTNQEWVGRGPETVLVSQKPEINMTC